MDLVEKAEARAMLGSKMLGAADLIFYAIRWLFQISDNDKKGSISSTHSSDRSGSQVR